MSNSFDHDQIERFIEPDLGQTCLTADDTQYTEQPILWYFINRGYVNQPTKQLTNSWYSNMATSLKTHLTVRSWMEKQCIFKNKIHLRNIIDRADV